MSETLGVAALKRRFSEILNRVEFRGERFTVLRRGRRVAVIAPSGDDLDASGISSSPRRGLAAAAGAWEDHPDIDRFIAEIREAREASGDRAVEEMQ